MTSCRISSRYRFFAPSLLSREALRVGEDREAVEDNIASGLAARESEGNGRD